MLNKFKLGSNLDINALPAIAELNDKYKDKGTILEFYGSTQKYAVTAARPDFRLPNVSDEDLAKYVKKALDYNIGFNWTMNSIAPYNTKQEMLAHKSEIIDCGKWLEDIGVSRITVTHPMLAMILREGGIKLPFELSTIAHLDSVTQLKLYKEMFGVDKVCMNYMHNRDLVFLKNCEKFCDDNGIMCDLMVNEFCYNTKDNSSAPCVFRDSCYICHANCVTKEDATSYGNYPMGYCMASRGNTEAGWLRSRYVLPEWIPMYNELTGVHHWKITGRTGSSEYLLKQAEMYLAQKSPEGQDLISLWKPLQSIYSGKDEADESKRYMNIPVNKIVENNFIDHWLKEDFRCHEHLCGFGKEVDPTFDEKKGYGDYACNFCKSFYDKHIAQ